MDNIQSALGALNKDPLTQALENAAQYQPMQAPVQQTPTPQYDLNNIGQYFQYQPLQAPQQQQAQMQQQTMPQQQKPVYSLSQLMQNTPAQNQTSKIQYRGKIYSANNPVLMQFPSSPHFKPSAEILMKAQEWENQNVANQAVLERKQMADEANSFVVTPELLNRLPQDSIYRNVLQPGQRVPFAQLDKFQKGVEAQENQTAIQAMLPDVAKSYEGISDDNPYKPMIQFALQQAIQSGDPKQLNYAYGLIGKLSSYITPKAQTTAQKQIDVAKGGQITANTGLIGAKTTGQKIENQYLPQTLQAGINQKNAGTNLANTRAAHVGDKKGSVSGGKQGSGGNGSLSRGEVNAVITNILANADTYRSKQDFTADINVNQRSRLVALLGVDGYNKLLRSAKSIKQDAVGKRFQPASQRKRKSGFVSSFLNDLEQQLK